MKALLLTLALGLIGCTTIGDQPGPLVETSRGEQPQVCYVRARNFHGLVPISCAEALEARP